MLNSINQLISLGRDFINIAKPEDILKGKRLFRPFMQYQTSWMTHFYPNDTMDPNVDTWFYLQKYMMPLIMKNASSYHVEGIKRLKLNEFTKPDFKAFQQLFYQASNGFSIEPVTDEISPMEYFSLIHQKRFPCIEKIRSHEELFCANEPDFWHEAIGHIAPLCFKEVQDFYLEIASYMLSATSEAEFQDHVAVAWTLTEYGFLKEKSQNKMFGAAMVGSHLAHMRYEQGLISVERAARDNIIKSEFHADNADIARDSTGNFRFFCLEKLEANPLFNNAN